jgi:hypothetical protein
MAESRRKRSRRVQEHRMSQVQFITDPLQDNDAEYLLFNLLLKVPLHNTVALGIKLPKHEVWRTY